MDTRLLFEGEKSSPAAESMVGTADRSFRNNLLHLRFYGDTIGNRQTKELALANEDS
jgi:hypothetical protein